MKQIFNDLKRENQTLEDDRMKNFKVVFPFQNLRLEEVRQFGCSATYYADHEGWLKQTIVTILQDTSTSELGLACNKIKDRVMDQLPRHKLTLVAKHTKNMTLLLA